VAQEYFEHEATGVAAEEHLGDGIAEAPEALALDRDDARVKLHADEGCAGAGELHFVHD